MKVLLVDDHALLRAGLRRLLELLPDVVVVGEAGDGAQAVEMAQRELPDIVITDISMPEMTGLELSAWLGRNIPQVKVIVLSMHEMEDYVLQALDAGAYGYLLKRSATEEIEQALRVVAAGEFYLSAGISRNVVDAFMSRRSGERRSSSGLRHASGERRRGSLITPRQREVLKLVALGKSTKEIAAQLGISPRTIDTHRAELMDRLGVRDAIGLLREASRLGLVDLDSKP
jgi:DNA-binding NarL/FixJ family response regulator